MIELNLEEELVDTSGVNLKVLGIGGAGGNAVNSMISSGELDHVKFIVANTDAQALNLSQAKQKLQLGKKITKGLGAGSNPDIGRRAAEEDIETITEHIADSDILFLTAGLGGGTGSGGIPVVAHIAREMGILTVAIVTKPFVFEGKRRMRQAEAALEQLRRAVDTLIVVPNQKLLQIVDQKISMLNAFALSNDILKQAIKGISDIITKAGHINVDFSDVKAIMKDTGIAMMGTGKASGPDRAAQAARHAISSPLLENVDINGASGVLINITGGQDLGLYEINEAASLIYEMASEDANIILGSVIDEAMEDSIMITVIATGFDGQHQTQQTEQEIYSTAQPVTREPQPIHQARQPSHTPRTQQEVVHELTKPQVHVQHTEPTKQESPKGYAQSTTIPEMHIDLQDYDVPTFLRKKAQEQQETKSEQRLEQAEQSTPDENATTLTETQQLHE
ncbi:MAG: cell division protein FtsZ [Epsilonproteobacteria bacterium]|nr:cell division protein FtsZ [Campylobacterota bacterium]